MKTRNKKTNYTNHELLTADGITVDLNLAMKCEMGHDPDSLLGNGFLCRGSGGILVGQSGVGKSTFAFQMACHFALGKDFFGLKCSNGPLKVLLVQSENDAREIAEVLQSVTEEWKPREREMVPQRLVVKIAWDKFGDNFAKFLRGAVTEHQPDLVIVDPLMGFLGADVSNNEEIALFLRSDVNGLLKDPPSGCKKFGIIFVHHTPKPSSVGKKGEKPSNATRKYDMLGAAEFINWARCIMRLELAVESGRAHFLIVKRGDRSGVPYHQSEGEWGCTVAHASAKSNSKRRALRWEIPNAPVQSVPIDESGLEAAFPPAVPTHGAPASKKEARNHWPKIAVKMES